MRALVGIGRLLALEVLDESTGAVRRIALRGKWLAWDSSAKCFHIGTAKRKVSTAPASVAKAHRRFHSAAPSGARELDVPARGSDAKPVGLLKALMYDVPRGEINSPEKNPHVWHHAFGDTGHKGGKYPTKVMPALLRDRRGNYFIQRRPGNIFTVDSWLRG